jgi:hypothetical protein
MAGRNKDPRRAVAMFRLDYLSCFLTAVATILVGRKMWTGLVVSGVNSLIVCVPIKVKMALPASGKISSIHEKGPPSLY